MMYNHTSRSQRKQRSTELLKMVGLGDRLNYKPTELSGGQMQRVAIARALANKPSLILADEPTGNLDSKTGGEVMKLLGKLHAGGNTVVVITHDEYVAKQAQRIINLRDGKIVRKLS
jgi:putative ABC transport system ATP-binding protein